MVSIFGLIMKRIIYIVLFFVLISSKCFAWNSMGHQLVAQIAYDNLTPEAKKMCNEYNRSYSVISPSPNFVAAAAWLDLIRASDVHWFDNLHYIDIPFSNDKTDLPAPQDLNALWGIKQAVSVLSSDKSSPSDKGLSLRILTHLVGDIHQPLHTATKVSKRLPNGDLGGNLFKLKKNPIGENLHQYWDNGGGILIGQRSATQIKNKALQLEQKWSCTVANQQKEPKQWIDSSHQLALTQVYATKQKTTPSKHYQLNAQNISQKQILFAGCRLANLLNKIALIQN